MTRREVEERFPQESADWERDPYTFAPKGGESGLAVTARALPVLIELVRENQGACVLVVSHKATLRLLLSSLLGFDPRRYRDNLDLDPASLTVVDFKGPSQARLALFNDTSHYAALPSVPTAQLSKTWNAIDGATTRAFPARRGASTAHRSISGCRPVCPHPFGASGVGAPSMTAVIEPKRRAAARL